MYCDVVSVFDDGMETQYSVSEDKTVNGKIKKIMYYVSFDKDTCQIVCSCHLFEFRGIICKHAVTVLFRNGVGLIHERYILRRWRRDISRLYTRVKVNYSGWDGKPGQKIYDQLCRAFARLADKVVGDKSRIKEITEWIEVQESKPCSSDSCIDTNIGEVQDGVSSAKIDIEDPKHVKRKGAPRKLRKKSALELTSKKSKVYFISK